MTEQQRRAAFHKATGRIATSESEMYYAYTRGLVDGAAAMKERAAKVCHEKAWELKSRAMKETGRVQRTRLNSEAIGWHDAHGAIRALGDDDD